MEIFNKIIKSSYLFNMKTSHFSVLDSARLGTETWFINHLPESISNCIVKDIKTHEGQLLIFYTKGYVKEGEELFFDYG